MDSKIIIREERISVEEYIDFLKRTDLGSQYPKECFEQRIAKLVENVTISLIARNEQNKAVGVLFGLTDFVYWLYITDLGVDRDDERQGIGYRDNYDAHAGSNNNSYMKDNNYNYRNNYKESYRNYPPDNRENNYSGRNNSGNEIKNNDNRYSGSKYYYDDGYNRKRFFNDNNYIDKRKSEYKGNSSNYMGNKYSDREERSRSRSKSWGRNHSRYRKDVMKREHSHSKSFHKFNDNYE